MSAPSCPYLGLRADRESFVAYPSLLNCCYHTHNTAIIAEEYQNSTCLTEEYPTCPVFQLRNLGNLPPIAVAPDYDRRYRVKYWSKRVILAIALLAISGLLWFVFTKTPLRSVLAAQGQDDDSTYQAPSYEYFIPTNEEYAPRTGGVNPGRTPIPTATFMWDAYAGLNGTEIANLMTAQLNLKIYRVKTGDNLDALARAYRTTQDAILAINYTIRIPIYVDEIIVIPENISDVSQLPKFETRKIQQRSTVEDISLINNCSNDLFRQYNQSVIVEVNKIEYVLEGTWVLIPRLNASNQP